MVNFYSLNNMPISRFNGSNSVIPGTFKRWGGTNLYSAQYNFINNYNMGGGPQMFGGYDYGCCNNNNGGFFGKLGDWLMGAGLVGGLVGGLMSLFGGKKSAEPSGLGATSDPKPTTPVATTPTPTQAPAIKNGVYSASAGKIDGKDMTSGSTFDGLGADSKGMKIKSEAQDDGLGTQFNIGDGTEQELTDKDGKLKTSITTTSAQGNKLTYQLNTDKYAIKDGKKYPIYTLQNGSNGYMNYKNDDYIVINGHFEQLADKEYTTASTDGQILNGVSAKAVTNNQTKIDSDTQQLNKAHMGTRTGALKMQDGKFKAVVNGKYIDSKEYDTQAEAEKAAQEAKNAPAERTPEHTEE
ncbi:MAG: hypothetical protein LKG27_05005 [Clostridiaceae bacterium]|jgi:hypothetical protein|nr:hypothetical protein [Clostridiaceae bacterium]